MAEVSGGGSCMSERYSRQILFAGIGEESQKRVVSTTCGLSRTGAAFGTMLLSGEVAAEIALENLR